MENLKQLTTLHKIWEKTLKFAETRHFCQKFWGFTVIIVECVKTEDKHLFVDMFWGNNRRSEKSTGKNG